MTLQYMISANIALILNKKKGENTMGKFKALALELEEEEDRACY